MYLDTLLNPYDTNFLEYLLQKLENLENYINHIYKGNIVSKVSLEFCLHAARSKVWATIGTQDALQRCIEEANTCTEIARLRAFDYSAPIVLCFFPLVISAHLYINDREKSYMDYKILQSMSKRYRSALHAIESLKLVMDDEYGTPKVVPKIENIVPSIDQLNQSL